MLSRITMSATRAAGHPKDVSCSVSGSSPTVVASPMLVAMFSQKKMPEARTTARLKSAVTARIAISSRRSRKAISPTASTAIVRRLTGRSTRPARRRSWDTLPDGRKRAQPQEYAAAMR
ncbi:hypothetical protein ACIPPS_31815 [Streptomyces sp. NPDC090127]|uniref:hypothetical protein n=1 Tax=Streptomyces sp. NPDC090127 TaxID=3365953 RepID=UPI0038146F94